MLREYAVEPEVFSDLDPFISIRVLEGFGYPNGRLISLFPKKWKRQVYEVLDKLDLQDGKKKAITLRLEKSIFAKRSCESWDPLKSWAENAELANEQDSFHVIISESGALTIYDLHNENPLWKASRQVRVPRTLDGFEVVAKEPLKFAKSVKFIDPHYSPSLSRFGTTLSKFVELANYGRKVKRFEYHLGHNNSTSDHFQETLQSKQHFLKLESGQEFYFFRWKALEDGNSENLHPRFILTECGGMHFDYGLDTGDGTNLVTLLEDDVYRDLENQFAEDSNAFELEDAWILKDKQVSKYTPA
jgi:hypothetical protein